MLENFSEKFVINLEKFHFPEARGEECRNGPPPAAFDEIRQERFDLGSYMTAIETLRYP